MPTFDFECLKCKNVFEFQRPFGSKENPPCPACKSKKTQKIFSAPTIVFKGDGWYKTAGQAKTGTGEKKEGDVIKGTEATPSTTLRAGNATEEKTPTKTESNPATLKKAEQKPEGNPKVNERPSR